MSPGAAALTALSSRLGGRVSLGVPQGGRGLATACLPTGLAELDRRLGGWPRGRLTDLVGGGTSGKLSLWFGAAREALFRREPEGGLSALIDLTGTVFPEAPWARGRLLVVRPRDLAAALRALDALVASGCFCLVGLEATGGLPRRGLPEPVRVRTARLARETGTTVVACADRTAFGSASALRLIVRPTPGGRLQLSIERSRQGACTDLVVRRPSFPFPGRDEPEKGQRVAVA